MTLIGATVKGKANFMAAAWVTRVNYTPPLIGVALGNSHYTNPGIIENRTFSVNIPGTDLMKKVDHCGMVSGSRSDKSKLFEVFYGGLKTAPMVAECPVSMECRLVKTVDLGADTLFIGEIAAVYSEEKFLKDGVPDVKKVRPFALTMHDNNYWTLGESIGKAWNAGKDIT